MCMHSTLERARFPCCPMKHCISEVQSEHNHKLSLDTHSHICVTHLELGRIHACLLHDSLQTMRIKMALICSTPTMFSDLQPVWVCVSLRTFQACSLAVFHSRLTKRTEKLWEFSNYLRTQRRNAGRGRHTGLTIWPIRFGAVESACGPSVFARVKLCSACMTQGSFLCEYHTPDEP